MTALQRLAERSGIEEAFRDAHGKTRRTSAETQQALLGAMGLQAGDEARAEAALRALDREEWEQPLPSVCVAYAETGPVAVDLTLQGEIGEVSWRLALEGGGEHRRRLDFGALALVDRRELDGRWLERRRLVLENVPWGYHRLTVQPGDGETLLIVTPGRCWLPSSIIEGRRLWGVAAQLYLLRSAGNWGIGDYGDLRRLLELLAARGTDVVGLNPLHAMFLDAPEHASPYSPASRLLLNVLNIDVADMPELAQCEEARALVASPAFQQQLAACRSAALVDYAGVAALKAPVLRLLFASCRAAAGERRWHEFEAFRRERGETLERGCLFLALREHFASSGSGQADWHTWPKAYRDPLSPEVVRFAEEHADLVTFHAWLQWLADSQLAAAAAAAAAKGMEVGLYRDLAVGADRAGAETWTNKAAVVANAQVGAPPDLYNPAGQDWGLPPFHPRALRQEAYRSFVELVRANMRHAGGLRLDHVMGLQHLYWVPKGKSPTEGAYVRYPVDDLVGILALESQRHRCLVVGEDLGTVPDGFRERMAAANILSYRVLFFEKDEEGLLAPERYPALALAVAGSHDLPTLRGWWEAGDIALKERLSLYPNADGAAKARSERDRDRKQLVAALRAERLLPMQGEPDVEALILAAHAYLARSRSALAMAQIDDITYEAEQVNVPATSLEHPNWRRRLSLTLEELGTHPRLDTLAGIFAVERGVPSR